MSASAFPKPALRPMLPSDGPLLAAIFQASIEELTEEDYDEGQRQAWASAADDEDAFAKKLGGWLTLIGTVQGSPVGFIALKGADHIEMFYVHPAVARQGVGTMLYEAIEKHRAYFLTTNTEKWRQILQKRAKIQFVGTLKDQALRVLLERIEAHGDSFDEMIQKIVDKESDPYTIAQQIIDRELG